MSASIVAVFISGAAFAVSLISLGWNIWSKFIFPKPHLRVGLMVMTVVQENKMGPKLVVLTVANHGPGHLQISGVAAKTANEAGYALLNPLEGDPRAAFSRGPFTGFPRKLDVGDEVSFYLVFEILDNPFYRVGVRDSFSRVHLCPANDVRKAKEERQRYLALGRDAGE